MYQIDMLKGRQLPGNSLLGVLFTGITFVIPIALAFVISIEYFDGRAYISAYDDKLSDYEFQLREMDEAKVRVDTVVLENQKISASLADVGEVLLRHTQWTDILVAISDNLPDSLRVNKLNVMRRTMTKTVDQRYGPKKKINISVPARTLVVSLYSVGGDGDDVAVRKLQKSLVEAKAFSDRVKDVVISLREPDVVEGADVVRYELNCIMKVD
jgi:hypothetical protein